MKTVIVEGWRFLAHSYALVNQFQCLEMLRRPDLTIYHRDVPFFNTRWQPTRGLFPPEYEERLSAIAPPPAGFRADAYLRIGFPHFFDRSPEADRTFIWVTSEYKIVQDLAIGVEKKAYHVLPQTQATIIACSRWAAQGFLNSGAPKSKVTVVPCGVDTDLFHPCTPEERVQLRRTLGWEGKFVALNVSSGTHNKGFDLLYKAIARLVPSHPSLMLSLKGSDDLYNSGAYAKGWFKLLSPGEKAAIEKRVTYQGVTMSSMDIAKYYQAADLYVSPYRAEGFNLPVLEAAACGLPVICTRGGSTEDFVDDSWCRRIDGKEGRAHSQGWEIEPNLNHLVALFEQAIKDDAWRASVMESGPRWVRERFTWKHSVDQLLKVMLG